MKHRVPSKRHPKRPTARHIIIKMAKFQDKERILKAAREKQEGIYKGAPIRLATDFSMETLQARREWQKIFQVMRTRGLQPTLLYPARLSIKPGGEGQIPYDLTFNWNIINKTNKQTKYNQRH